MTDLRIYDSVLLAQKTAKINSAVKNLKEVPNEKNGIVIGGIGFFLFHCCGRSGRNKEIVLSVLQIWKRSF
ncbi:MAG: hypothetical protein AAB948_01820 [Patescibacteria group bacterium]